MKRLFNTEDGELQESLVPEGISVNLKIKFAIEELIFDLAAEGWSMRDIEALALSHVQMTCARAIIARRKIR